MPAVPLAVPDGQAAASEQLDAIRGGRPVDALGPREHNEDGEPGGEHRREKAGANPQDHATDFNERRRPPAGRAEICRWPPPPRLKHERRHVDETRSSARCGSQTALRSITVTLRLITDTTEVPPTAPAGAGPKLPSAAFVDLFNHAGTLLAILDDEARFVAVNPACLRVLGYPPEELIGRSLMDACIRTTQPRRYASAAGEHGWQEGFVELLGRHRHADGSWRWLLWSGSAHGEPLVRLCEGRHRVAAARAPRRPRPADGPSQPRGLHRRADARARAPRSLEPPPRASSSSTSIPSSRSTTASATRPATALLAEAAAAAARRGSRRATSSRASAATSSRSCSSCSRATTRRSRSRVACSQGVRAALRARQRRHGQRFGAASASRPRTTRHKPADRLIREADIAMYRAKATGRNRFAIFDTPLRVAVDRRLTVERDLRSALASNEFSSLLPAGRLADRRHSRLLRGAGSLDPPRVGS